MTFEDKQQFARLSNTKDPELWDFVLLHMKDFDAVSWSMFAFMCIIHKAPDSFVEHAKPLYLQCKTSEEFSKIKFCDRVRLAGVFGE